MPLRQTLRCRINSIGRLPPRSCRRTWSHRLPRRRSSTRVVAQPQARSCLLTAMSHGPRHRRIVSILAATLKHPARHRLQQRGLPRQPSSAPHRHNRETPVPIHEHLPVPLSAGSLVDVNSPSITSTHPQMESMSFTPRLGHILYVHAEDAIQSLHRFCHVRGRSYGWR